MKNNMLKPIAISVSIALLSACGTPISDKEQSKNDASSGSQQSVTSVEKESKPEFIVMEAAQTRPAPQPQLQVLRSDFASAKRVKAGHISRPTPIYRPMEPVLEQPNSEKYADTPENSLFTTQTDPVSTFSLDVDSASYTNVRRMLNQGVMPDKNAIRTEEFINYFDYQYPSSDSEHPFHLNTQLAPSPWGEGKHLMAIGLQAESKPMEKSNLVFLVDISGSMQSANKLPLLIKSLKLMVRQLDKDDRVSIVTYAGQTGTALESTAGDQQHKIISALEKLQTGGSTNGSGGIIEAYRQAKSGFIEDGVNRVILATDGDFNVGISDIEKLKELIEEKRDSGIALTTLGFGAGNYNDHLMEKLSNAGNGNSAYIDNIREAQKVLVDELSANMQIVAKDAKIQVEFNPQQVAEYRLVGYQNRMLKREDFNNDKVDAGDIGAGHSVTAIYEITLTGSANRQIDPLRYAENSPQNTDFGDELAQIKLRYKKPNEKNSQLLTQVIDKNQLSNSVSGELAFAASVAGFAQLLKGGKYLSDYTYQDTIELANKHKGKDTFGYRAEFVNLVRTAQILAQTETTQGNTDKHYVRSSK